MLFIENPDITAPHINLAMEEYMLRQVVDRTPILFLYLNTEAVVVGRNQNVFEEVDLAYCRNMQIPVLRRLSGGGTVYHDLGNLNYCLITPDQELLNDYATFTRPLVKTLETFGIESELRNRSSLFINGHKISGNAQYASGGRLVSHGTVLFNADLETLRLAVRPPKGEHQSRAVKSIRSHVTNLAGALNGQLDLGAFKARLREQFLGSTKVDSLQLNADDWSHIKDLAAERYLSWAWNIGRSPRSTIVRRVHTPKGARELSLLIDSGTVRQADVRGDDQMSNHASGTLEFLTGIRFEPDTINRALDGCDPSKLPTGVTVALLREMLDY